MAKELYKFEPFKLTIGQQNEIGIAHNLEWVLINPNRVELIGENGDKLAIESDAPLRFSWQE